MLFNIKASEPVRETCPDIDSIPEFEGITDRQIRYVILVYDYDSPYRQQPLDERKVRVAKDVGYSYNPDTSKITEREGKNIINNDIPDVVRAIKKYRELQYDEERDLLMAYDEQLLQFKEFFRKKGKTEDEIKLALAITKQYNELISDRKAMIESLGLKGEIGDEEDEFADEALSLIDQVNMGIKKTNYE